MTPDHSQTIFVFGSNLAGRHGKGSALYARIHYNAEYGVGIGRTGNAYAIPTKGRKLQTLPLSIIHQHVNNFRDYARAHPELNFKCVAIGCGLAGYTPAEISPMFEGMPPNVTLPHEFFTQS